jgi:hypothetical protein
VGITAQPKIDFSPVYTCKVADVEALTKLRERTMHA